MIHVMWFYLFQLLLLEDIWLDNPDFSEVKLWIEHRGFEFLSKNIIDYFHANFYGFLMIEFGWSCILLENNGLSDLDVPIRDHEIWILVHLDVELVEQLLVTDACGIWVFKEFLEQWLV